MHRRSWHRVLVAVAAGLLLLAAWPSQVLCIGPGGHRAVEPAGATCCTGAAPRRADAQLPGTFGDCRGNCQDTVLRIPTVAQGNGDGLHQPPAVGSALPSADGTALRGRMPNESGPAASPPRRARVTVLRC